MNYRNILPLVSHTQELSTDYWNDFGYWNDGTFWYEKTPTYTARVTAYAAATGITDYTILDPLNIFDLGLTYYGLDTIMKAIYPMVTDKTSQSDMANQMKYNFMNPLDTNAAFRLNWVGGWVYSRTGALPNGVNAYADTNFNPSTSSTLNNTHFSFYSRTNIESTALDFGNADTSGNQWLLALRYTGVGIISDQYNSTTGRITNANTDSRGFYISDRTASNIHKAFKNSSQIGTTSTGASGTFRNLNLYLSAVNQNGSAISFSNKECAFSSIGNGLTDSQAQIFSSLVNNLQIALNRAVY